MGSPTRAAMEAVFAMMEESERHGPVDSPLYREWYEESPWELPEVPIFARALDAYAASVLRGMAAGPGEVPCILDTPALADWLRAAADRIEKGEG